jgi:hypothetical protein
MTRLEQHIKDVKTWELRRGKNELLRHLEGGKPLTQREAILAQCYNCTCGFADGRQDCGVPACPLHPFMQFREGGVKKRPVSEEQRKAAGERFKKTKETINATVKRNLQSA